jgi:molybdopterin-guanine dinucleotide biosynthesis protein A
MNSSISGVILAGGENRRFGGNAKSHIVIGGKSIISGMVGIMNDIFDEIIIVTNTPEKFSEFKRCKITGDFFLNAGPLGGIHAAMKASGKDALFVFAGDMPFLEKGLIISEIDRFSEKKCDALVPRVGEYPEPLHSIYSNSILNKLEEYLTENACHAVRDFFPGIDVSYMEIDPSDKKIRSFTNINTPEDLAGSNFPKGT